MADPGGGGGVIYFNGTHSDIHTALVYNTVPVVDPGGGGGTHPSWPLPKKNKNDPVFTIL